MPESTTLILLLMLTTAHAVLMVSAAMVISVQSTSVKAANLLASFIVIPVAIMMQGESVLLFWGTDQVLWMAVVAVVIMAGLLVRLGLAHFQREYMLGREFDSLNLSWMWRIFWKAFRGEAQSVRGWYAVQVRGAVGRLTIGLVVVAVVAVAGYWISYRWATVNVPAMLSAAKTSDLQNLVKDARQSVGLVQARQHLSAAFILLNNLRATLVVFVGGLVSFSVLGVMAYMANVGLVGAVLGVFSLIGYSPTLLFAAGILPHGVFEIPALMLTTAAVLRMGAVLVTPQTGKSMGQVILEVVADCAKIFVGLVVPLLTVAALVEAYITPLILINVLK